jgi:hypothetical protein
LENNLLDDQKGGKTLCNYSLKNCFRGQNLQLCGSGSYPMADLGICGVHPLAYTIINFGMFNIYPQSHHF